MQTKDTTPTFPLESFMLELGELMERFGQGPNWLIAQDEDGQVTIHTGLTLGLNAHGSAVVKPMD